MITLGPTYIQHIRLTRSRSFISLISVTGNRAMSIKKCLNSKSVIVTGGNRGIGLQAALKLAGEGARIILGCRDMKSAAEAKQLV